MQEKLKKRKQRMHENKYNCAEIQVCLSGSHMVTIRTYPQKLLLTFSAFITLNLK